MCPFCGSLPRGRRLWNVLSNKQLLQGKLLHFSPSPSLVRVLQEQPQLDYLTSDLLDEFRADYKFDLTAIELEDDSIDTIICFHVLEHITEDAKAMAELYRVLKPNGIALIQTPFKTGAIYENPEIQRPLDRLEHFGQEDHVRIYSVNGLSNRLKQAGFTIDTHTYEEVVELGLKKGEHILFAQKI